MRIVLSLLLLLLTSASAYAQTLQIERIDVLEHGIYTADESNCSRDAQGILTCVRSNVRLAAATWTIPAQHGVHFGLRFRVIGVPNGTPISLKRVLIYPPAGLHPPSPAPPISRREAAYSANVGEVQGFDYAFDDPWEVVPGPWTLQYWYGDRKLLEQTFTVVNQ